MSTLTATQLQQQYIAYFGRPGDPAGIKYWLSSAGGVSSAREFADKIYAQDEYKKSTVGTKSTEAQVNQLYKNLFGREADAEGLIYWTGQIESGTLSLSNVAYDLIWAASNPIEANTAQATADALALTNKVAAAEAFTADVEASTAAILAYQPESTDPWVSGAAFESASSYITGITATAHTEAAIDTAVDAMKTATTTTAVSSTTSKFTTSQDVLSGGAGDDIFNGVVIAAAATGTTAQPGDQIDGGAGSDTLNLSFSGAAGSAYTLEAVDTDKVEKVVVSNFETSVNATTVSASLFDSSLTTVGLSSSSATGDTVFSGLTKNVNAEMRNGAADLTITYDSSVVSGTADTQNLAVSAVTGGTFGAANTETLAITTELAKSKLTNISSTGLKTINISGDQTFEVVSDLATKTIDASSSTGAVTLRLGSAAQTITGSTADDTIDGGTVVTKDDTIKGGAGTDTLKLDIGNSTYDGATDDELDNVSEFEVIDVNSTNDNATLELDTLWNGVTDIVAGANTKTYTVDAVANSLAIAFTVNGTSYTTAATDGDATAAEAATLIGNVIDAVDGLEATVAAAVITVTNTASEYLAFTVPTGGATAATFGGLKDVTFSDADGTETLTIHTGDLVTLRLKDASGASDVAKVNIKPHSSDTKYNQTIGDIDIANTETLQLGVTGLHDDYTYTLSAISGDSTLSTINITGDSNLTVSNVSSDNTKLKTINASTFTNDLTFSDAAAEKQTITTGTGNDSIAFAGNLTEDDVIDLGANTALADGTAGKDTVTATGDLGTSVDDSVLQIANVETFQLTNAGVAATYIDASKITGTQNLAFSNTSGTVKIKNLAADATIGLGVGVAEFGETTTTTLDIALADETGSSDSVTLDMSDTTNTANEVTLKSTGIETLNVKATKEASNNVTNTITFGTNAPSKVVVTDGHSGDTLALGTLNSTTTTVDASAYKGKLTLTGATGVAMTVSANGKVVNSITTSTGNDTITLGGDLVATAQTISAGTGTDVLNISSLSVTDTALTSVSGVETINFTVKDSTSAGLDNAGEDDGLQTATTINILGGNALSKFVMTTATIDNNSIDQTIDSSTFAGAVELNFASDALDSNITVKGGASTDDKVTLVLAADTPIKPASITGIETLVVTSTDNDLDATIDLSNVTGLTAVNASYAGANGDQIEIDKLPAGTTVKVTGNATSPADPDVLDLGLSDASTSSTAATVEITTFAGTNDKLDIDAVGVETLNLYNKGGAATNQFDLAGVTATSGSDTKVVVTGKGGTLKALSTSFNEVDASNATAAITLAAADRPATAMTITTSTGGDSIAMEHANDVISSGTGTDTLTITANGVLGGFAVDLSATDQVTQFAGVSNSKVQQGFENVTGSGITGTFGLDVTGSDGSNTITGSSNVDIIRGGKGTDTIVQTAGADELHGGAGVDRFTLDDIMHSNTAVVDTIKDFTVGASGDTFEISIADIKQKTGITDLIGIGEGTNSITQGEALALVTISAATNMSSTTAEIGRLSHATAFDTASVKTALVASGNLALTAEGETAIADAFLVIYDDNTDSYLASVRVDTTAVANAQTYVAGKTTVENLVKFEGIADATTFTDENIRVALT